MFNSPLPPRNPPNHLLRLRLPGPRRPLRPNRPGGDRRASPLAPKTPHFTPRAKRVIFMFMQGGPSHVDTFDYKPALERDDGKSPGGRRRRQGQPQAAEVALEVQSPAARAACRSPSCSRTWPSTPTTCACSTACTPTCRTIRRRPCSCTPAASSSSGRAWARGCCTAWAPRTRSCPASSRSTRSRRVGGALNYGSSFLPAPFQGTPIGGEGQSLANAVDSQHRQPRADRASSSGSSSTCCNRSTATGWRRTR